MMLKLVCTCNLFLWHVLRALGWDCVVPLRRLVCMSLLMFQSSVAAAKFCCFLWLGIEMGILIELYCTCIRLFHSCGRTSCKHLFNLLLVLSAMLSYGLLFWFIALILLSGDVERNLIHGILLNTRSVKSVHQNRNKLIELQSLVALRQTKLICLSETWLSSDILGTEILLSDQFHVYRKDRRCA